MKFDKGIAKKYRNALEEAVKIVIEKGNKQQRFVAKLIEKTDILIRVVPLKEINVSGVCGVIDNVRTNERIANEVIDVETAMGEIYITFSDWCWDVAGMRGCTGTLVHEGLHAYDFARIISSFSKADTEPDNVLDLTLYELERRAAVTSGEYLSIIAEPDYISDGLALDLISLDKNGKPAVDYKAIEQRMQNGYGLNAKEQGVKMSDMLGLKPKSKGFFNKLFG